MLKLAVILGVPIALMATVASLGVVVVDVREGGPDGHRIVVPVPLVLAQAAVALAPVAAPDKAMRIPEDAAEHMGLAREVVEALAEAPDGEFVRVEERDETVVISKEGRTLKVRVTVASQRSAPGTLGATFSTEMSKSPSGVVAGLQSPSTRVCSGSAV